MSSYKQRLWYDITMALTFPAVLGAVIYSLLDTGMKEIFTNVLVSIHLVESNDVVISPAQSPFLNGFGLSSNEGLFTYLGITFFVALQYSCDYLYSKYFEDRYHLEHFIYDIFISVALGISFVQFSAGVRGNFTVLRASLIVLWFGFIVHI